MLDEKTLEDIHNKVCNDVETVWNSQYAPISFTYCTKCDPLSKGVKRRCISMMMSLETRCPACWAREREEKIIKEVEEARRPKLDLEDFTRL